MRNTAIQVTSCTGRNNPLTSCSHLDEIHIASTALLPVKVWFESKVGATNTNFSLTPSLDSRSKPTWQVLFVPDNPSAPMPLFGNLVLPIGLEPGHYSLQLLRLPAEQVTLDAAPVDGSSHIPWASAAPVFVILLLLVVAFVVVALKRMTLATKQRGLAALEDDDFDNPDADRIKLIGLNSTIESRNNAAQS